MSLKPLASAKAPDLINFDRDSQVKEIMERMRLMPGWSDIWAAEQYQDASQFVIQVFSYLFEKNAMAANRIVRESLLSEAWSERAVYANLAQMRVNATQNRESTVELIGRIQGAPLTKPLVLPRQLKVPATGLGGGGVIFEVLPRDETGAYQYLDSVIIQPGNFARNAFRCTAYSGETKSVISRIEAWALENSRIQVPFNDIIEGSVQAFYRTPNFIMIPLRQTTKFVVEPYITPQTQAYFPNGVPHFIVRYGAAGTATVYFGSEKFGGAFGKEHTGGSIVIYCRVGGGRASNIVANSINYSTTVSVPGDRDYVITFSNPNGAYGGEDRENYLDAKVFAPLRYGRDGTNVVVDDAKASLYRMVVKHEVDTPRYSEVANNVPLLHAFHYIVPKRNLSGWDPPIPYDLEDLDSYVPRAFLSLNEFLGVRGTNDAPVLREIVSNFVGADEFGEYNFLYILARKKPLSGTLSLTAWDYEDEPVDSVKWGGNYYASESQASDPSTEHAELVSQPFSAITVINNSGGNNSVIKMKFDGMPYVFTLTLPLGSSVTASMAATSLQSQMEYIIQNDPAAAQYFYQSRSFKFFEARPRGDGSTSSLVVMSPLTGKSSKIELLPHGLTPPAGLEQYSMLGIEVGTYRPPRETELVFKTCTYHHETGEIEVMVDKTEIDDRTSDFYPTSAWQQDVGVQDGPEIELRLLDEKPGKIVQIVPNTPVTVEALKWNQAISDYDVVDALTYESVAEDGTTTPTAVTGAVFDSTKLSDMELTRGDATIKLKFVDGVELPQWTQAFPAITKIEVHRVVFDSGSGEWIPSNPAPYPLTYVESECPDDEGNFAQWTQDRFSDVGPVAILRVLNKDPDGLVPGNTYEAWIYKQFGGGHAIMQKVRFEDVPATGLLEATAIVDVGDLCIDQTDVTRICAYDADAGRITLYFLPPTPDDGAAPYYVNGYEDFDMLRVTYQKQTYAYMTAAYTPNPYMPEDEAKAYADVLRSKSRRMVGLEDIIKDVNFAPVGGTLNITIGQGFSEYTAFTVAKKALLDNFGYDNSNPNHTIGTRITSDEVQAAVTRALAQDFGLEAVSFTPSNDFASLSTADVERTYFFVCDDDMVDAIKSVEDANRSLLGLSQLFEITINVISRKRR